MVFVHGYNNTFDAAAQRAAQFIYDTGFSGAAIIYSWPSQGATALTGRYTIDEKRQSADCPSFVHFVSEIVKDLGEEPGITIVAHSMGSRLVFSALTACVNSGAEIPPEIDIEDLLGDEPINVDRGSTFDVVLAAPDIPTDVFEKYAVEVAVKVDHLTIYASANDKALRAGMGLLHGGEARLGVGGSSRAIIAGVHTIDASSVEAADFLQHAYVFNQKRVIQDAGEILGENRNPDCRTWPIRQDDAELPYWILDKRKDPPLRNSGC